jgi:hypothetical protein
MYFIINIYKENEASKIKKEMEQINKLTVIDVISKKDKHPRPEGLNTVNLLKVKILIKYNFLIKK